MANGFDFCGIGSYCYSCKTKKDLNDYILTSIIPTLLGNRETLVSLFLWVLFYFSPIPSLLHFLQSPFLETVLPDLFLIVMEYCVPLRGCTLVFSATCGGLLYFEVSLDLEVSCFLCGFLSGNSVVCDNDAKQAQDWLESLGWARTMEIGFSLVDTIGVHDFIVSPMT